MCVYTEGFPYIWSTKGACLAQLSAGANFLGSVCKDLDVWFIRPLILHVMLAHHCHFDVALSHKQMLVNLRFTVVKTRIEKQKYFSLAAVGMLLKLGMRKESFWYS